MDNELEQKNITIAGIEDKGWGISLIDEHGLKYNVSKFLKGTQNETKAFQVLKTLPGYGMGMRKCVKFATVPNQQGGQSRYVRIIGEVEAEQPQSPIPPKNTPTGNLGANKANVEPNWDSINFGKCKHAFLVEAFKKLKEGEAYDLDGKERLAERWAERSMRRLGQPEVKNYGGGEQVTEDPFYDLGKSIN